MAQEQLLQSFTSLLETRFLPVSHEKRSLALCLSVTLLRLAPAEHFPMILSKPLVRLVLAARANKKHTLHAFTAGIIENWREAVGNVNF